MRLSVLLLAVLSCIALELTLAAPRPAPGPDPAPQGFWNRASNFGSRQWSRARDATRRGYNFARGAARGTGSMYNAYR